MLRIGAGGSFLRLASGGALAAPEPEPTPPVAGYSLVWSYQFTQGVPALREGTTGPTYEWRPRSGGDYISERGYSHVGGRDTDRDPVGNPVDGEAALNPLYTPDGGATYPYAAYSGLLAEDGQLRIRMQATPSALYASNGGILPPNRKWISAYLSTNASVLLKYGWIEVRAKLPRFDGMWPCIWLLSNQFPYLVSNGSYYTPEIDLLDGLNLAFTKIQLGVVCDRVNNPGVIYGGYVDPPSSLVDGNYHTFAVHWTSTGFEFFVDRVSVYTLAMSSMTASEQVLYTTYPMFLIVNLAVGGVHGLPSGGQSWPQDFCIDWARWWQQT